jgi:hypothetical protein
MLSPMHLYEYVRREIPLRLYIVLTFTDFRTRDRKGGHGVWGSSFAHGDDEISCIKLGGSS